MRTFFLSLRRQWWIILAFLIIIGLTVLYIFTMRARAAPEQPIAFNHQIMVGFGIDCLYCHTDAIRSPAAGIPSMEKCMGCHSIIDTQNAEIQKVAGYWERQEPIPWGRVNHLPRFQLIAAATATRVSRRSLCPSARCNATPVSPQNSFGDLMSRLVRLFSGESSGISERLIRSRGLSDFDSQIR